MDNPIISYLRKPPSLKGIKRALFIQPHPDDDQIGAGGMMAYLVDKGAEVYELTVTDDRYLEPDKEESATTRQKEALAAQKYLGVKNAGFLGFYDKTRATVDEISVKILEVIRRIRPDAVFAPDPNLATECHSDHIKVGTAAKYAVLDCMCDFYPSLKEDGSRRDDAFTVNILAFYYTDKPNRKVDITEYFDKKTGSVRCHASQVGNDLLMFIKELARISAKGTKYKYCEGFRALSSLQMHCFNISADNDNEEE